MARGTTWTYKPKGPPLRIRVTIYCDWPECPKPNVASWRPRSAKVRAKLSPYTYCSRSHAQKDWRRREQEKWLAAQPPYQCAYLLCNNELWLTGEPGRPRDYCTPEHKAAAQRDRERRQPGGAVERATPPALFALQRAADAWQRAVGARIDLHRWVADHMPKPVTEAELLRRFEADKQAYQEELSRYEEALAKHPEELSRYEEALAKHPEELGHYEEMSRLQAKERTWRTTKFNGSIPAHVDWLMGRGPKLKYPLRESPDALLRRSRGPTYAELEALYAWQPPSQRPSEPLRPQMPQPPQPPQPPELPPPAPALSLSDARERDRQGAKMDELEDAAAADTRRALELGAALRSARERLARRAETARLRRAKVLEAEEVERRRDDPEYDA